MPSVACLPSCASCLPGRTSTPTVPAEPILTDKGRLDGRQVALNLATHVGSSWGRKDGGGLEGCNGEDECASDVEMHSMVSFPAGSQGQGVRASMCVCCMIFLYSTSTRVEKSLDEGVSHAVS